MSAYGPVYCRLLQKLPNLTEATPSYAKAREQLISTLKFLTADSDCPSIQNSDDWAISISLSVIFAMLTALMFAGYVMISEGNQALLSLEAYNLPVLSASELEESKKNLAVPTDKNRTKRTGAQSHARWLAMLNAGESFYYGVLRKL
jgi:hypothetical protein